MRRRSARTRDLTWNEILQSKVMHQQEIQTAAEEKRLSPGNVHIVTDCDNRIRNHSNQVLYLDVELMMRPALALGCFFFIVVGCPVGIWFGRSDYLSSFITCFMPIVFVYYPLMLCGTGMAKEGRLNPVMMVWAADLLLGCIGAALLQRLVRKSSWNARNESDVGTIESRVQLSASTAGLRMAKLYFYYSTMNAGKSTSLLQAAHNYAERGMSALLFTAQLDKRAGGKIASRIGIYADAQWFDSDTDFWTLLANVRTNCILVDEAQFLSQTQVRQLARVVDEANIPVMCYGLRTDFRGELFPGSAALLAWADSLSELKTICCCGKKATMVVRVALGGVVELAGQQVEVGGNERYVSLCRKHFSEAMNTGICPGWRRD